MFILNTYLTPIIAFRAYSVEKNDNKVAKNTIANNMYKKGNVTDGARSVFCGKGKVN